MKIGLERFVFFVTRKGSLFKTKETDSLPFNQFKVQLHTQLLKESE